MSNTWWPKSRRGRDRGVGSDESSPLLPQFMRDVAVTPVSSFAASQDDVDNDDGVNPYGNDVEVALVDHMNMVVSTSGADEDPVRYQSESLSSNNRSAAELKLWQDREAVRRSIQALAPLLSDSSSRSIGKNSIAADAGTARDRDGLKRSTFRPSMLKPAQSIPSRLTSPLRLRTDADDESDWATGDSNHRQQRGLLRPIRSVTRRITGGRSARTLSSPPQQQQQSPPFASTVDATADRVVVESPPTHRVGSAPATTNHVPANAWSPREAHSHPPTLVRVQDHNSYPSNAFALPSDPSSPTDIVRGLEQSLRFVGMLLLAYLVGVYYPDALPHLERVLEYVIVAWSTCVVILLLYHAQTWWYQWSLSRQRRAETASPKQAAEASERTALVSSRSQSVTTRGAPLLAMVSEEAEGDDQPMTAAEEITAREQEPTFSLHPALDPFFMMENQRRVSCNDVNHPFILDTEYFTGCMVVLIRTPDVDDDQQPSVSGNAAAARYFEGKQRRFEFQFQLQLKKLPTGRVYFACELEESVKMGVIQRAFVSAAMAFVKTTNPAFHYSLTGSPPTLDGAHEKPHMAFPVEASMDRLVATPPGQPLPVLGTAIHEDPESIKQRKKAGRYDWNLENTYTMALWSSYMDFLQWKCINLPGIRPFALNNVVGTQPIILTLYDIPASKATDKHYRRDLKNIVRLEMSHAAHSGMGPAARLWQPVRGDGVPNRDVLPEVSQDLLAAPTEPEEIEEAQSDLGDESDNDVDDDDSSTVAELAEGIYVRSGDKLSLRLTTIGSGGDAYDDHPTFMYVSSGAGFAVVQEGANETIVIEKVKRFRRKKATGRNILKHGDTVQVKMISTVGGKASESKAQFLVLHRAWWLKWVSNPSGKSSHFVIEILENEGFGIGLTERDSAASYLTFGGSFALRHAKGRSWMVGVAGEASAAYGGRQLGLFQPKINGPEDQSDPSDDDYIFEQSPLARGKNRSNWLKPLALRAIDVTSGAQPSLAPRRSATRDEALNDDEGRHERLQLSFSSEDYRMDAPAWIELLNRRERVSHLMYVVRVTPPDEDPDNDDSDNENDEGNATNLQSFVRLRSGRDLADVVRTGLNSGIRVAQRRGSALSTLVQSRVDEGSRTPTRTVSSGSLAALVEQDFSPPITPQESKSTMLESQPLQRSYHGHKSYDDLIELSERQGEPLANNDEAEEDDWSCRSADEADQIRREGFDDRIDRSLLLEGRVGNLVKGRRFINSIAKKVGSGTTNAGKSVVNASVKVTKGTVNAGVKVTKGTVNAGVKVTKGTVNAGKALITPMMISKTPPTKEPRSKSGGTVSRKRRERDLLAAVAPSMKRNARSRVKVQEQGSIAGQLSAAEQSCRTVSSLLINMSGLPPSARSTRFSSLLASKIDSPSEDDLSFLRGGAVELGVVPVAAKGSKVSEFVVARCLWESHWREELCTIHEHQLAFYAPMSRDPSLEILFTDVQTLRSIDSSRCPLAGYPVLAIETGWLCYYVAFVDEGMRESFHTTVTNAMAKEQHDNDPLRALQQKELAQARFWQGFQTSIESSLSSGKGKWADVASGKKLKRRIILNNRRMYFDLSNDAEDPNDLVENLSLMCLPFSLDSLEKDPDALVRFLDATSKLQRVRIHHLDFGSASAFCMFVNIYHCLLQHALLVTPSGPLTKRTYGHFMRTMCYEIGGDVFSLAELYSVGSEVSGCPRCLLLYLSCLTSMLRRLLSSMHAVRDSREHDSPDHSASAVHGLASHRRPISSFCLNNRATLY
jgi:Protein of unknown function (DUF1769)